LCFPAETLGSVCSYEPRRCLAFMDQRATPPLLGFLLEDIPILIGEKSIEQGWEAAHHSNE
jgi:hypothetical protein